MNTEAIVRVGVLLGLAGPGSMLAILGGASLAGKPLREAATGYLARWIFLVSAVCFGGLLALSPGLSLPVEVSVGRWFGVGSYAFEVVLLADPLSLSFAFFAALLCGLVAAFSHRYLHREPGYQRFFLLLALFGAGILLIALAGSIELAFAGWEFVGLSSALLIAFFHDRALPVKNGLITFVIYRISDIGIFWAAVLVHHYLATGRYIDFLGPSWPRGETSLAPPQATLVALFLALAAIGKCAQLPFSSWLPRAMEGPTPSSAIFYGALSVHAGAFLLLRMGPVLDRAPWVAALIVVIGLATAIHATLVGRVQTDIKSALAYATLTQVGIIFAEIGLGFRWLPLLHMLGHAVLRSVQFLRAPSVLHDFHSAESALGSHMSRSGIHLERLFPRVLGSWMYRFALERNYVEAALDRFIVYPLLGVFRRLDRLESRWVRRAGEGSMAEFGVPWITLIVGLPLIGAGLLSIGAMDAHRRLVAVTASAIEVLVCLVAAIAYRETFSSPLLPFLAGIVLVTLLTRPRRTEHDGFFRRALLTEAILLAAFTCRHAPTLVPLWWALAVLPLLELRSATEEGLASFRFEAAYLFGSAALFSAGVLLQYLGFSAPGGVLIVLAVLSRAGMFPFHSWVPAFFGRVPPGPAMLAMAPQFAVYSATVLLLSGEHPWLLVVISVSALVTTIHAAALGLVQRDARRALAWLFLSQSAGVLVGMASGSAEGSAGGLMIWISCGSAGTGLALALWALEARRGRLDLDRSHGGYDRMPLLASSFLLMGLALVGFPGTLGFVGQELLVEGLRGAGPYAGFLILLATALNGITLLRMYFRLFCGTRDRAPAEQSLRLRERIGFTAIVLLLILGGLAPRAIVDRVTPSPSPPPASAPGLHR